MEQQLNIETSQYEGVFVPTFTSNKTARQPRIQAAIWQYADDVAMVANSENTS